MTGADWFILVVTVVALEGFFGPIQGIIAAWRCRGKDGEND